MIFSFGKKAQNKREAPLEWLKAYHGFRPGSVYAQVWTEGGDAGPVKTIDRFLMGKNL
jgi:hypothetical protein